MSSRFLISATTSGSGKTTLTLGLLRALRKRGLSTQPFKCGPDYIDIKYHNLASGNKSVNLDLFLASESHVKTIFAKYAHDKDVCVTEGVMGLFDGYDRMQGSSASVARLTGQPVILVINAKSMAYSAAALLYGFKNFYKDINIAGVIFNFVASESHYSFLKDACTDVGLEALGYMPKNAEVEIPSRHLGLNIDEQFVFDEFADKVAGLVEKHINIDRLLEITQAKPLEYMKESGRDTNKALNVAVAFDEAFNFVYQENISALGEKYNVHFFSPLRDKCLPDADLIYLPGGYPELYLPELSGNKQMLAAMKDFADRGGNIWAECGGMMYLCESIADKEGMKYPVVGIFPQEATMQNMKLKLGYRAFKYAGLNVKGHEFHYSRIENDGKLASEATIYTAKGVATDTGLLRYKNVLAGYTHIYWGEFDLMDLFG